MSSLYTPIITDNSSRGSSVNTSQASSAPLEDPNSDDSLYETNLPPSEVSLVNKGGQSQTSIVLKQDVNKGGLLSMLEKDVSYDSSGEASYQINPQSITPNQPESIY